MDGRPSSRWWRWAGLLAAAAVYLVAIGTLEFGFLLSPVALAVAAFAVRRVPRPRGVLVWIGLAVNAVLTLGTLFVFLGIAFDWADAGAD